MNQSCFMFGHADCPQSALHRIEEAIETFCTKYGIRFLYVGNRGQFDRIAVTAAKRVKLRYPDLQLFLLLAYRPAERTVALTEGFDNSYYPPLAAVPKPYAIVRANKYMIDNCNFIICYVQHRGNTEALWAYAHQKQKSRPLIIKNVAM